MFVEGEEKKRRREEEIGKLAHCVLCAEEGEEKKSQQQQEQLFVYGGKRLVPGLLRLVCGGSSFCSEGAATHSVSENHTKFEKTTEKGAALHSSPFSAVWKGFLRIQHEGTYTFKLVDISSVDLITYSTE
eukprot:g18801.t1